MPSRHRAPCHPRTHPVEHLFPEWGVDVFESHHADGWRMDRTTHDFLKVVFVLQGAGALVTEGGRSDCHAGQAIVVPLGLPHQLEDSTEAPMSLYVVSVQPRIVAATATPAGVLPSGVVDLEPTEASRVERGMRRLLFEQTLDQPTTGLSMVAQTLRLLVVLARSTQSAPGPATPAQIKRVTLKSGDSLARVQAYVDELSLHFYEATNLDAAASGLNLSRRRFTQLFRDVTGSSWLGWVRRLRVEHACRLLSSTERTVLSVAFECGFDDLSTFYRAFKRETGVSPNRWRDDGSGCEPRANSAD